MNDVSGFGLQINLVASITFPQGITITAFADDIDPLDVAAMQLKDKAMGLNGDLIVWSKATPIPMVLGIIPNSVDDINLKVLAENNRVGKGKRAVRDVITATITYPNGEVTKCINGAITDAIIAKSVASAGRLKSMPYTFAFENKN